jgi:hypothetical protein
MCVCMLFFFFNLNPFKNKLCLHRGLGIGNMIPLQLFSSHSLQSGVLEKQETGSVSKKHPRDVDKVAP